MTATPGRISKSHAILAQLASEQRRLLSEWRALILLRRATFDIPAAQRRWLDLPRTLDDVRSELRSMSRRGDIVPLQSARTVYLVVSPYASAIPLHEYEVLGELNPYAAISHYSALAFHNLTRQFPNSITASAPTRRLADMVPIGTAQRDWDGLDFQPAMRFPTQAMNKQVIWTRMAPDQFFGNDVSEPYGFPIRVTNPERTLLDALNAPKRSGGILNVLEAWASAPDRIDVDLLVHYVERFDSGVLRQRVGFILEELGLTHSVLKTWQSQTQRGGSRKLDASAPYSSTYSERWDLSLNGPVEVLRDEGDER